jgi:NADPH-dependent 2,4-dienoyl-CoA reductase/sulfur reductase-like enzyme
LLHAGVHPNIQFSQSLGLDHSWNEANQCWDPDTDAMGRSSKPAIYIAGDGAGVLGADAAKLSGQLAAMALLQDREYDVDAAVVAATLAGHRRFRTIRAFLDRLYAPKAWHSKPDDDVIICRCEEVTAGKVRDAVSLGCLGPNQLKAFSRCGMGNCQGRYCGLTVVNLISETRGLSPADVGYYRIRSPIKPITLEEIANHDIIN